jgi:Holliday junction DNA helicase RuvB
MFFDKNKLRSLLFHPVNREDKLFTDIYGCDDIKKLFRMALESNHTCSILLTGPPASAKTLFLQVFLG